MISAIVMRAELRDCYEGPGCLKIRRIRQSAARDWTPRSNVSGAGRPPAATSGLWAMGSPDLLVENIVAMGEGDYLLVVTDGALMRVMESVEGSWRSVPQMGGGWVIGIAKNGTNPELVGVGRVEWVAAGAVQVVLTSWGGKSLLLPGQVRLDGGGYEGADNGVGQPQWGHK